MQARLLVWEWTLTLDDRDLLRWALETKVAMPKDVAALIKSIQNDTKAVRVCEDQFSSLLSIGDAASESGTHHAISSRMFKERLQKVQRNKPVDQKATAEKKKETQMDLFGAT